MDTGWFSSWLLWIERQWTWMWKCPCWWDAVSFRATPRSGTAVVGLLLFQFLRECPDCFSRDCTTSHLHQQGTKAPFSHMLSAFGIDCFLGDRLFLFTGVRRNLKVALISISQMPREVEHFCIASHLWFFWELCSSIAYILATILQ